MSGKTTGLMLYEQAVIFDIEATSLSRQGSIVEGSFYRVRNQKLTEFHLAPNFTAVELGRLDRDAAQLRSHPSDSIKFLNTSSDKESLVKQLILEEKQKGIHAGAFQSFDEEVQYLMDPQNEAKLLGRMKVATPYQYSTIKGGKFPRISAQFNTQFAPRNLSKGEQEIKDQLDSRIKELKQAGKYSLVQQASMEDFLNQGVARHAQQGALWIANVNYEGKQLGARLSAYESDYRRSMVFKSLGEEQAKKRFLEEGLDQKEIDRLHKLSKKSKRELREILYQSDKNMTPARLSQLEMSLNVRGSFTQTNLNTTDLFSVTGKEVNEAIAMSRIDGDWRRVYGAYINNTKAGDVRDIMDVIRAQLSYSQNFGLIRTNKINNLSMDMAYRLYGASIADTAEEAARYLRTPELHTSSGDTLITENLVLKSSLAQTQALYELEQDPEQAKAMIRRMTMDGGDHLMKAVRFATLIDSAQEIEQANVEKRLMRALDDIITRGESSQATNEFKMRSSERVRFEKDLSGRTTMVNEQVKVAQVARYETYNNLEDVYSHIRKYGQYAEENVEAAIESFEGRLSTATADGDYTKLKGYAADAAQGKLQGQQRTAAIQTLNALDSQIDRVGEEIFENLAKSIQSQRLNVYAGIDELKKQIGRNRIAQNYKAMEVADARILKMAGMYGVAAMAAIGAVGLASDAVFGNAGQRQGDANLRTMNYHRWLEANQEFAGLYDPTKEQDGMTHVGLGSLLRKANTDFGSPYQGPTYTQFVFQHQELLRERERYTRAMFSERHFSIKGDIGNYLLSQSTSRIKHSIDISGIKVDTGSFAGLRAGGQAIKLDMSKYNAEVEDADTIVLRRAGVAGFVSRMFGLNDTGSVIRVSGIDAPETAHAGRQAMAYAEMSKGALNAMLKQGQLDVVIDPTNITYGRAMGSLFVDGQNVATNLLKRGLVAHLPFNKKGTRSMQDDNIYSSFEHLAQGMDYNMWGAAQYKVYEDFVKQSGKRITFNTLVNPQKVAKNGTQMSIAALMSSAEQMGFYSNVLQSEVASIAEVARGSNMAPDWSSPILNRQMVAKTHKDYINYLVNDVTRFTRERETGIANPASTSFKKDFNKAMALDSVGTSDSIYSKQRYKAYDLYQVDRPKKQYKRKMAEMQKKQNKEFGRSPIGHWRM